MIKQKTVFGTRNSAFWVSTVIGCLSFLSCYIVSHVVFNVDAKMSKDKKLLTASILLASKFVSFIISTILCRLRKYAFAMGFFSCSSLQISREIFSSLIKFFNASSFDVSMSLIVSEKRFSSWSSNFMSEYLSILEQPSPFVPDWS